MNTRFQTALSQIVGQKNVSVTPKILRKFSFGALRPYRAYCVPDEGFTPDIVVWPRSTKEVSDILSLASEEKIPVVAYGGGTGLMGGAVALRGGVILNMRRMNKILDISRNDLTVVVEAGVVLEKLNSALNKLGLFLGHDPWTRGYATVGGAISTNGLGYTGGKYGSFGDQVLGLEAVLADGSVVSTRASQRSSTGLDVKQLFIGTEGTLGIITRATLRVFPIPEFMEIITVRFASFNRCFRAVCELFQKGIRPTVLEASEKPERDSETGLFLMFDGLNAEVRTNVDKASAVCRKTGGEIPPRKHAMDFWSQRHEIAHEYARRVRLFESGRTLIPSTVKFEYVHVCLPASKIEAYRRAVKNVFAKERVDIIEFGLWNQPELFSMVLHCESKTEKEAVVRLGAAVNDAITLAQDMGGSMEYCHGVGLRLARLMKREHGRALKIMSIIKHTIDPRDILNPAKMFS